MAQQRHNLHCSYSAIQLFGEGFYGIAIFSHYDIDTPELLERGIQRAFNALDAAEVHTDRQVVVAGGVLEGQLGRVSRRCRDLVTAVKDLLNKGISKAAGSTFGVEGCTHQHNVLWR